MTKRMLVFTAIATVALALSCFSVPSTIMAGFDLDVAQAHGSVSFNEQEVEDGYFAIGQDLVAMARPGTPLHKWLKAHHGQPLRVTFEVDHDAPPTH